MDAKSPPITFADKPPSTFAEKLAAMKWGFILRWIAIITIATPFVVAIGLAPIVNQPLYNWLLFHPHKYHAGDYANPSVTGTTPIDVYFTSGSGVKLHGFLYKLPGAKRVFLVSHGNGSNLYARRPVVAFLLRTGSSVFIYDYAGYGRSEGNPSLEEFSQDASAAYQYLLTQEHYTPKRIILFGESIGTAVTGYLAGSVDCAGVILECPLYSIRRVGCDLISYLDKYPDWAWTAGERQFDNSVALKKSHAPLLLIAGTADHMTPIKYADELFALAPSPKRIIRIDGAGHGDRVMMLSPDYARGLRQFLDDLK